MPLKRQVGQVMRIDLHNGHYTYGYEINHGELTVVDVITKDSLTLSDILERPGLFCVGVLDRDVLAWQSVGNIELEAWQKKRPNKFIQDPIDLSIFIIDDDGKKYSATFEQVQELERASGWSNFHVEQRVRDYFANKTNIIVEIERPKPRLLLTLAPE